MSEFIVIEQYQTQPKVRVLDTDSSSLEELIDDRNLSFEIFPLTQGNLEDRIRWLFDSKPSGWLRVAKELMDVMAHRGC